MEGVLHIGHFRFEFTQAWRRIADQLTGQTRERWCLLLAADAVENAEPDDDQVRLLRAANALTNPMWLVRSMYNAYTDHDPVDFAGAGAVLAQLGEHYAGRSEEHTSELQSLMRISYAVFCLQKTNTEAY